MSTAAETPEQAFLSPSSSSPKVGREIVKSISEQIERAGIFDVFDTSLLERIAWVESSYGLDAEGDPAGGIWRVSLEMFRYTRMSAATCSWCLPLAKASVFDRIQKEFDIGWTSVVWNQIQQPLYSALAAGLWLSVGIGSADKPLRTAAMFKVEAQAKIWQQCYYNSERIRLRLTDSELVDRFIQKVNANESNKESVPFITRLQNKETDEPSVTVRPRTASAEMTGNMSQPKTPRSPSMAMERAGRMSKQRRQPTVRDSASGTVEDENNLTIIATDKLASEETSPSGEDWSVNNFSESKDPEVLRKYSSHLCKRISEAGEVGESLNNNSQSSYNDSEEKDTSDISRIFSSGRGLLDDSDESSISLVKSDHCSCNSDSGFQKKWKIPTVLMIFLLAVVVAVLLIAVMVVMSSLIVVMVEMMMAFIVMTASAALMPVTLSSLPMVPII